MQDYRNCRSCGSQKRRLQNYAGIKLTSYAECAVGLTVPQAEGTVQLSKPARQPRSYSFAVLLSDQHFQIAAAVLLRTCGQLVKPLDQPLEILNAPFNASPKHGAFIVTE